VLVSLRAVSERLFDERHPLSGVDARSEPLFRTVAQSPALGARAREIVSELQVVLATELADDPLVEGDAPLLSTLFIAGYSSVMVETARRPIAGGLPTSVVDDHGARLERLFEALRSGVRLSGRDVQQRKRSPAI
jgi:hypothetical protein